MVVIQYPHTVTFKLNNWSNNIGSSYSINGRVEPVGNVVSAKQGFDIDDPTAIAIIYMPLTVEEIEIGIPVEVLWNGNMIASGPVKQFSRGQLNARVWI